MADIAPLDFSANCIDEQVAADTFDTLRELINLASGGTRDVRCDPIDATVTNDTRPAPVPDAGDGCSVVVAEAVEPTCATIVPAGEFSLDDDECLFLLTMNPRITVAGNAEGRLSTIVNYTVMCGNTTVHSGSIPGDQITGSMFVGQCRRGSEVTICADVVATQTAVGGADDEGAGDFKVTVDLQVCGGRFCKTMRLFDQGNTYVPCQIPAGCCIDSSFVDLLIQNSNALSAFFSFGGRTVECFTSTTIGDDATVIATPINDAVYIAMGTTTVCVNRLDPGDTVTVKPVVGCRDNQAACVTAVIERKSDEQFRWYREFCREVPILTCGECPAGEFIYSGVIPNEIDCGCDPDDPAGALPIIADITTDWCLWMFETVDASGDLEPIGYPGECLTRSPLRRLEENSAAMIEVACNVDPINCTTRCEPATVDELAPLLIQPAQSWPPPTPPPRPVPDPPPVKKWRVEGSIQLCGPVDTTFNLEDNVFMAAYYEIRCGGAVIHTGPSCPWQLAGSGQYNNCSPPITVSANVECPIDQDLTINGVVDLELGIPPAIDYMATIDVKALCF